MWNIKTKVRQQELREWDWAFEKVEGYRNEGVDERTKRQVEDANQGVTERKRNRNPQEVIQPQETQKRTQPEKSINRTGQEWRSHRNLITLWRTHLSQKWQSLFAWRAQASQVVSHWKAEPRKVETQQNGRNVKVEHGIDS